VAVRDCLSEPPRCAEPEWSVEDAMDAMAEQQVGRLSSIRADASSAW
jgi:hypothetical protein